MSDEFALVPVFRELRVPGGSDQLDALADEVTKHVVAPWSRDRETEANGHGNWRVFARSGDGRPALRLFLVSDRDDVYVSNIVPADRHELSMKEYNEAVVEFDEQFLTPAAAATGLSTRLGVDELDLRRELPADVVNALTSFSASANRSTGSSHPMDQERWFDFVLRLHRSGVKLTPGTLGEWLVADGWSEEMALDLTIEFETAVALLTYVDAH